MENLIRNYVSILTIVLSRFLNNLSDIQELLL